MSYPTGLFDDVSGLIDEYAASFGNDGLDTDEIDEEILSRMNGAGYTKLPSGTYRHVYASDGGGHVVKFGVGRLGKQENSAEIRNNTRMSKARIEDVVGSGRCSGSKYIADVLAYQTGGHGWLVMEAVTVTSNNVTVETAEEVRQAFADAGIHVDEIEPVNMGVSDEGVPVVFDYAGT